MLMLDAMPIMLYARASYVTAKIRHDALLIYYTPIADATLRHIAYAYVYVMAAYGVAYYGYVFRCLR